mmetsp:Transcript_37595/g.87901  ORF Transcript_37595/g.87901 Transcript_37595/m.87901 type:complete len:634 (-) Transcript_37595:84-1985(-)|eukprot:CAMPEP_0119378168 /NCGR_PEP_ID=MMETSP1334-20130426/47442_1 /TAXON_ID=127549 /ORGANISM="Calcidiscus leptoporus, Strain RCC1130" /LENGTH=633 /DNA_ID=CAMNT_0007397289 /DNA_START=304 /DNA_END=2205 /DNA_ORIENTATION=-
MRADRNENGKISSVRRRMRKTPSPEKLQGALLAASALSAWTSPQAPTHDIAKVLEEMVNLDQPPDISRSRLEDDFVGGENESDNAEICTRSDSSLKDFASCNADLTPATAAALENPTVDVIKALVCLVLNTEAPAIARNAAAAALKHLATSPSATRQLVEEGAPEVFAAVIASGHPGSPMPAAPVARIEQCIRAVGNLAAQEGMAPYVQQLGVVQHFVLRLSIGSGSMQEAALCALSNLAELPATRRLLAEHGTVPLLRAATYAPQRASTQAGWLVCLLASDANTAPYILSAPSGLRTIFAHARKPQAAANEEAAWALATLSAHQQHARTLASVGESIVLLFELLGSSTIAVSLQASWALANLALQPNARARMMTSASLTSLVEAIKREGEPLFTRQSLRCLGSLLAESRFRKLLPGNSTVLQTLLDVAGGGLSDVCDAAVRALAHACRHPNSVALQLISLPDTLPVLVKLLSDDSLESTHCEAATCVANIAYQCSDPALLLEDSLVSVIPPLVARLESKTKRTQSQAAIALCNISAIEDHRFAIIQAGALTALARLLGSPQKDAQEASHKALDALTRMLSPNSRRVFLRPNSGRRNLRGSGKAADRHSPLTVQHRAADSQLSSPLNHDNSTP